LSRALLIQPSGAAWQDSLLALTKHYVQISDSEHRYTCPFVFTNIYLSADTYTPTCMHAHFLGSECWVKIAALCAWPRLVIRTGEAILFQTSRLRLSCGFGGLSIDTWANTFVRLLVLVVKRREPQCVRRRIKSLLIARANGKCSASQHSPFPTHKNYTTAYCSENLLRSR